MHAFDYALVRVVPRPHLGGGEPIGVILQCRQRQFLGIEWTAAAGTLARRWPELAPLLPRYLAAMERAASGDGPIGRYPESERFHWLTATRSTVLQPSHVHTGLTSDPRHSLHRLVADLRDGGAR